MISEIDFTPKTFLQWMENQYDQDELQDIAMHGCASVCAGGLIYYSETSAIYDIFADELHEQITQFQSDIGEAGLPEYITSNFTPVYSFKNAVVWFVAELYANQLV